MKINIKATNIELTPGISAYVEKKMLAVEKHLPAGAEILAQVEVGKSTQHHKSGEIFKAEIHLSGAGIDQYAMSEQTDLYAAIDTLKDDIVRNLTHTKGRRFALARRGARAVKDMMRGFNPFRRRL